MKRGDNLFCWEVSGIRYYFDHFVASKQTYFLLALVIISLVDIFARGSLVFLSIVGGIYGAYFLVLLVMGLFNRFQYIIDQEGIKLFKNTYLINAERHDEVESITPHRIVRAITFYRKFIDRKRVKGTYKMNLLVSCPKEHFQDIIDFVDRKRKTNKQSKSKR